MKNVRQIRTMTAKVTFKAIYKAIGFSDDAGTELTDTEVVDSMPKLSQDICSPGGAGSQKGRSTIL